MEINYQIIEDKHKKLCDNFLLTLKDQNDISSIKFYYRGKGMKPIGNDIGYWNIYCTIFYKPKFVTGIDRSKDYYYE